MKMLICELSTQCKILNLSLIDQDFGPLSGIHQLPNMSNKLLSSLKSKSFEGLTCLDSVFQHRGRSSYEPTCRFIQIPSINKQPYFIFLQVISRLFFEIPSKKSSHNMIDDEAFIHICEGLKKFALLKNLTLDLSRYNLQCNQNNSIYSSRCRLLTDTAVNKLMRSLKRCFSLEDLSLNLSQ